MNNTEQSMDWCNSPFISGRTKILEDVRILIYREYPNLFELLDFDNDKIFNEPLLFAYFYSNGKGVTLSQLLLGHIEKSKRPESIEAMVAEDGLIYLSEIGWIKTALRNQKVKLVKDNNDLSGVSVFSESIQVPFTFEPQSNLYNTPIEIVGHQHPLLAPHYFDSKKRLVKVEIDEIAKRQKGNLTKAFNLIQNLAPEFYNLLEQAIQKVVVFNDPSVKRNSFATFSVHGCAFFNSFQPEYDEVFFIEDIAHQCGHVIFNNMIHRDNDIFRVLPDTIIKERGFLGKIVNLLEKRSLFVAFHALFTYYAITLCLRACLLHGPLTVLQKHEALGRLAFCLRKFGNDVELLCKKDKAGKSIYFTEAGLELYRPMEALYKKTKEEWSKSIKSINLFNQPYNFSNKKFHKANPIR